MIALLQEIWAIIVVFWNTGNRWIRWALVIFMSWPVATIISAISVPLLVPYIALLPLFTIVLLFIAWLDPLVVVAIAAFPKGRMALKWLAGIIAVELVIGIYLSVVPVINNPVLVPLLILVITAMVFLFISPIKNKWAKRILYVLVVIITIIFFLPNTMKAIKEKGKRWDERTAISLLEEKPKQPTTAQPRVAEVERSICEGPAMYEFAGKTEISVPIRPECWSGWIDIPTDVAYYEINSGAEGWHERLQWNGEKFFAGKGQAPWKPLRRASNGTFRLRGEGEASKAVITITIEKT